MDLLSLASELHLRGFDQDTVDAALRCLTHVYAVEGVAAPEQGGILAEDIVNTYPPDVVQAASELFLDATEVQGREVFRVRGGYQDAAETIEEELWSNSAGRWGEFVAQLDDRYLGFVLPTAEEGARVLSDWKLGRELKWFSVAVPRHGWRVLRFLDDLAGVAMKLDLAFEYRPFGEDGIWGRRTVLHEDAYAALKERGSFPDDELRRSIRLWRFFSEFDVQSTDFVALMEECGLALEDVTAQVDSFSEANLTSRFREGQYPPYLVNDKKKKEFQAAVRALLGPMDSWLSRGAPVRAPVASEAPEEGTG